MFKLLVVKLKVDSKLTTIANTSCVPTDFHKSKVHMVDMQLVKVGHTYATKVFSTKASKILSTKMFFGGKTTLGHNL
jgi:hypothetical protein